MSHTLISQLRTTLGKFEIAFSAIEESIIITDISGKIEWCNHAFDLLIDKPHITFLGQELFNILPLHFNSKIISVENHPFFILNKKKYFRKEYQYYKNNELHFVLFSGRKIIDKGIEEHCVFVIQDITDQKKASLDLLETNKTLSRVNEDLNQYASIISHDLKTPLRSIHIFCQWILRDHYDNLKPKAQELVKKIKDHVEQLYTLINGILEFSQIGHDHQKKVSIDLNPLIEKIIEMANPENTASIKMESKFPVVKGDPTMMHQIFSNLINNSIKHSSPHVKHPQINLSFVDRGPLWEFCICDNGPGIPKELHDKVFEIFQTVDSTNKANTGVGLSIVKKIISAYNCKVWVRSKPGEGSRFFFTYPKK